MLSKAIFVNKTDIYIWVKKNLIKYITVYADELFGGFMSIHIIDTFRDCNRCFIDAVFSKEKWNEYIDNYLPYAREEIEYDVSKYNFKTDKLPVLNNVYLKKEEMIIMHESFLNVVLNVEEKIKQKLEDASINVVIVLYLGLCNGSGWAVSLADIPHILLGMEKIIELNWYNENEMKGLIYHELGHVWHKQNRSTIFPLLNTMKDRAIWQLYSEGVAMYFEQLLYDDESFYHQDIDGWLNWCNKNRIMLFNEYIRVIENSESHQKFFGDWCDYLGVSDVGYYLGCELIKYLLKTRRTSDILDLSLNDIEMALYSISGYSNG